MRLSTLITVLQVKLIDFGDVEVKFGELANPVRDSKLYEIKDVTVEDFEYGKNTIILWDK